MVVSTKVSVLREEETEVSDLELLRHDQAMPLLLPAHPHKLLLSRCLHSHHLIPHLRGTRKVSAFED